MNKRTWMSCVREVASPELDCLLGFAQISPCCAKGWVDTLHWAVAWDCSHNKSSSPAPLCLLHQQHCSIGTAILREVEWLFLGDGARSISTRTLSTFPKKFLCSSVLIVTLSDGKNKRGLCIVVQSQNSKNTLDCSF